MRTSNYSQQQKEYINAVRKSLHSSQDFEVQSSGGKLKWYFMHDENGNLLVKAPMRIRWTKVLNPGATITAIATGKDSFIMHVEPLEETECDYSVEAKLLMVRIDQLCIA